MLLPSTSGTSTIRGQVLVLKAGWADAVWSIIISQCQWPFVFDMSHEAHKSACYNLKESISGCKMANIWCFRCCLHVHRITGPTCGRLLMYNHDHCMRFAFRKLHLFSHVNAGSLLERLQGRPQWNSEQAHVWWLERWSALILNVQHSSSFLLEFLTLVFTCVWNFKYKYMRIPIRVCNFFKSVIHFLITF